MANPKTSYLTLETSGTGIYKEKGSKFLSFSFPVNCMEDIKNILEKFKKDYFDARHICYAYSIGPEREEIRYNDDGEPSGTAGRPIYGQILSNNITNCLIVVVRYFGGTLLGTGGLITAYKEAALEAIKDAGIIECEILLTFQVSVEFLQLNDFMKLIKEFNVKIINQNFDSICNYTIEVKLSDNDNFIHKLKKIDNLTFSE